MIEGHRAIPRSQLKVVVDTSISLSLLEREDHDQILVSNKEVVIDAYSSS